MSRGTRAPGAVVFPPLRCADVVEEMSILPSRSWWLSSMLDRDRGVAVEGCRAMPVDERNEGAREIDRAAAAQGVFAGRAEFFC